MKRLVIFLVVVCSIMTLGIYNGSRRQNRGDIYGRIVMVGPKHWSGNHLNGTYDQTIGIKSDNKTIYIAIGDTKDESSLFDSSNIGDSVKVSYKNIDFDNITILN